MVDLTGLCTQNLCADANVGDAIELKCGGKNELLNTFTALFSNFDNDTTISQCGLSNTTTAATISQSKTTEFLCPDVVSARMHLCLCS